MWLLTKLKISVMSHHYMHGQRDGTVLSLCVCVCLCCHKIAVKFDFSKSKQATSQSETKGGSLQDRQVLAGISMARKFENRKNEMH